MDNFIKTDAYEINYPNQSPYVYGGNNPIFLKDFNGDAPTKFYFTEFSIGAGFASPYLDYYHQSGTAYDDIGVTFFVMSKSNDLISHTREYYRTKGYKDADGVFGFDISAGIGAQFVFENTFYESIKATETNIPMSLNLKGLWGVSLSISFEEDSWWPNSIGGSTGPGLGFKFSLINSKLDFAVSITSKESEKLKGLGKIHTTYKIEKIKILDGASGKEQEVNRLYGFVTKGGKLTKIDTGINLKLEVNDLKEDQKIYKSDEYSRQEKEINEEK